MSETVTAPDILNEIKAGQLVVVPREARNAAAPENAGDAEALRVALELMNMRQNNGTKRDDLLYEAAAFLKRRGYLVPASPDHTTALLSLVEGMERERDKAQRLVNQLSDDITFLRKRRGDLVRARDAAEARALAAEAKVEALREALAKLASECVAEFSADGKWSNEGQLVRRKTVERARKLTEQNNG